METELCTGLLVLNKQVVAKIKILHCFVKVRCKDATWRNIFSKHVTNSYIRTLK